MVAHRCNPSSHVLIASNSGQLVDDGVERSAEDPPKVVAALPHPPLKGAKHTSKTLSIATLKSFDLIGDFSISEIIVSYRLGEQWPSFLEVNEDLLSAKAVRTMDSETFAAELTRSNHGATPHSAAVAKKKDGILLTVSSNEQAFVSANCAPVLSMKDKYGSRNLS